MGYIQGCNICKSPEDVEEINTNKFRNNIVAKKLFETKLKKIKKYLL